MNSSADHPFFRRCPCASLTSQYFNSEVYDANNLTQQFVTEETCMVTMMEFISATLIALTYFTTRSEHHTPRAIP